MGVVALGWKQLEAERNYKKGKKFANDKFVGSLASLKVVAFLDATEDDECLNEKARRDQPETATFEQWLCKIG